MKKHLHYKLHRLTLHVVEPMTTLPSANDQDKRMFQVRVLKSTIKRIKSEAIRLGWTPGKVVDELAATGLPLGSESTGREP